MNSKQLKPDPHLEQRNFALNNNPCSICRALGFPTCKGHGSSRGGQEEASDNDEVSNKDKSSINESTANDLTIALGQSALWLKPDDLIFEFNHSDALMSVTIDMEQGTILFLGKEDLSHAQNIALKEFFQTIKQELNEFKKDCSVSANQMQLELVDNKCKIRISNPKLFDAFVQRLLDKNILSTDLESIPINNRDTVSESKQDANNQYKSPTPFDISGPKPE